MKTTCLSKLAFGAALALWAGAAQAQPLPRLDRLQPDTVLGEVLVKPLYSDAETSTFAIWIRHAVRAHRHEHHTEQVYVVRGRAKMRLDDRTFTIRKGDWILIPKGSVHAVEVLSKKPLLVISVQAPQFDGRDRVWVEE
jgi:mannose-6-phosphate isomerase-like protein (cupin superfamily)